MHWKSDLKHQKPSVDIVWKKTDYIQEYVSIFKMQYFATFSIIGLIIFNNHDILNTVFNLQKPFFPFSSGVEMSLSIFEQFICAFNFLTLESLLYQILYCHLYVMNLWGKWHGEAKYTQWNKEPQQEENILFLAKQATIQHLFWQQSSKIQIFLCRDMLVYCSSPWNLAFFTTFKLLVLHYFKNSIPNNLYIKK